MLRKFLAKPNVVSILLFIQIIPILLLPPSSYSPTTQEWWLPVLLSFFALVGAFQLVVRRTVVLWPWYLVSFAQGFNIISRLMLFMPHASVNVNGVEQLNTLYVVLSIISMIISLGYIIFAELPDVRMSLLNTPKEAQPSQ